MGLRHRLLFRKTLSFFELFIEGFPRTGINLPKRLLFKSTRKIQSLQKCACVLFG